eukprot:IDg10631t1
MSSIGSFREFLITSNTTQRCRPDCPHKRIRYLDEFFGHLFNNVHQFPTVIWGGLAEVRTVVSLVDGIDDSQRQLGAVFGVSARAIVETGGRSPPHDVARNFLDAPDVHLAVRVARAFGDMYDVEEDGSIVFRIICLATSTGAERATGRGFCGYECSVWCSSAS